MIRIQRLIAAGCLIAAVWPAAPATADAIDGNWCAVDGRHFIIDGPAITTPGGARTTGNYRRHYFAYTVPKPEPNAGAAVLMTLVNEETIHLKVDVPGAETEVWRRCDLTS
ncbi:MAG: hypothetical protein MI806_00710 [Minwuiales bacterium]|nr:hypothetical protein [Minwuiales bacterium]